MRAVRASLSRHRIELTAMTGLACLYLAFMSGHLLSIDGLVMWRQAVSMTYHHSWALVPPIWWGSVVTSSGRGVGASMQYLPGLVLFSWLAGHIPVQAAPQYDFRLLYGDLLYVVAGAPIWIVITAFTAYVVALTTTALGFARGPALWAMAFYGVGSPAFAASRGDWPQPLVAICWAVGIFACLRFSATGSRRWLWISGASIAYGVLTRPLEGSMLLPGVILLLFPVWRWRPLAAAGQIGAWGAAVAATLLLNWARFGSPLNFSYQGQLMWTTPIWVGFPSALLSPGRGVIWEFPALVLGVLGTWLLWRTGKRLYAIALAGLPAVLFLEACVYFDWIGGWDWGFRFFQPALPLLAVLAGAGTAALPSSLKAWLPVVLLSAGVVWNIPAVTTDILGGYGLTYSTTAANWRLDAYPPIGAWRFLHHIFPSGGSDGYAIDIAWFRATRLAGKVAIVPFFVLLGAAALLWTVALRAAALASRSLASRGTSG